MANSRRFAPAFLALFAPLPFACDAQRAAAPPETAPIPTAADVASSAAPIAASASAPVASAPSSAPPASAPPASAPVASAAPASSSDDCGDNENCARGNMFGDQIGDAFGAGGIGLAGGDAGAPRDGGARIAGTIKLRQGPTVVNGRLPPEVIQRIVRQNFGRFRLCYEAALRKKPKLAGDVVLRFVIARDGNVSSANDHASTIADPYMVACVLRSFGSLSFPQPEGGIVTVTYTIKFSID